MEAHHVILLLALNLRELLLLLLPELLKQMSRDGLFLLRELRLHFPLQLRARQAERGGQLRSEAARLRLPLRRLKLLLNARHELTLLLLMLLLKANKLLLMNAKEGLQLLSRRKMGK